MHFEFSGIVLLQCLEYMEFFEAKFLHSFAYPLVTVEKWTVGIIPNVVLSDPLESWLLGMSGLGQLSPNPFNSPDWLNNSNSIQQINRGK